MAKYVISIITHQNLMEIKWQLNHDLVGDNSKKEDQLCRKMYRQKLPKIKLNQQPTENNFKFGKTQQ